MRWIEASELVGRYTRGEEVAIIDVREQWDFCRGHALLASSCPLSSLELSINQLVPRKSAPIVVMDDGSPEPDALSRRAATVLASLGFGEVSILQGGVAGWMSAGYALFTGIHAFSKLLGEVVDHTCRPPVITPDEFCAAEPGVLLIDVRPGEEYARSTVPGSINIPAGELSRTIPRVANDETPLVLHCGGRTRGIIAAQTLREMGVPNPIGVLENGTIGWRLSHRDTVPGSGRFADTAFIRPDAAPLDERAGAALLDRAGAQRLDGAGLGRIMDDSNRRTTYVFDVRSEAEFVSDYHPVAVHAPAGQLVQETDRFVATRNARLILLDDDGGRAAFAARWLSMMGWSDLHWAPLESWRAIRGCHRQEPLLPATADFAIDVEKAWALAQTAEAAVLDLSASTNYEAGHVPGAFFAIRSMLRAQTLESIGRRRFLLLISEDGALAKVARNEVAAFFDGIVLVPNGGMAAWMTAGLPLERGATSMLHAPLDVRRSIYQQPGDIEAAMRGYIDWEMALTEKARSETYLPFFSRV